jgi:hypothetical protein
MMDDPAMSSLGKVTQFKFPEPADAKDHGSQLRSTMQYQALEKIQIWREL